MFQKVKTAVVKFVDEHLEAAALWLLDHKGKVLLADAAFSLTMYLLGAGSWALWAHILLLQNWAFTFVSRARNSGSLSRHLQAGFLSNFVWWVSQIIIFTKLIAYLGGQHGVRTAVLTGLYYTAFTLTGSIVAHAQSLRKERGKSAVGANARYAQVSVEDWEKVKQLLAEFPNVQRIAEEAHVCAVGALPIGGLVTKVAGQTVVSGLPAELVKA